MADNETILDLNARADKLITATRAAQDALSELGKATVRVSNTLDNRFKRMNATSLTLSKSIRRLGTGFRAATRGIDAFVNSVSKIDERSDFVKGIEKVDNLLTTSFNTTAPVRRIENLARAFGGLNKELKDTAKALTGAERSATKAKAPSKTRTATTIVGDGDAAADAKAAREAAAQVKRTRAAEKKVAAARSRSAQERSKRVSLDVDREIGLDRWKKALREVDAELKKGRLNINKELKLQERTWKGFWARLRGDAKRSASSVTGSSTRMAVATKVNFRSMENSVARLRISLLNMRTAFSFLAGGAVITKVVSFAGDFEEALSEVNTLLVGSEVSIERYKDQLLALAETSPKSLLDSTKALYQVISAGIPTIEGSAGAFNVLEQAQKAAVAGLATAEEGVNALLTLMNAYSDSALTAAEASDKLFQTVVLGRTTFQQLQGSLGRVAGISAQYGVTVNELLGSIAALTRVLPSTNESVTQFRSLLTSIVSPTERARETLAKLAEVTGDQGLTNLFSAASIKAIGFTGVMSKLTEATGGNADVIAKLFPNVRALAAATLLAGDNFYDTEQIMARMTKSVGATDNAVSKVTDNFKNAAAILKNKFGIALVEIGEKILPQLSTAFESLGDFLGENSGEIADLFETIVGGLIKISKFLARNIELAADLLKIFLALKVASAIGTGLSALKVAAAGATGGAAFVKGFSAVLSKFALLIPGIIAGGPVVWAVAAVAAGTAMAVAFWDAFTSDPAAEEAGREVFRKMVKSGKQDFAEAQGFTSPENYANEIDRISKGLVLLQGLDVGTNITANITDALTGPKTKQSIVEFADAFQEALGQANLDPRSQFQSQVPEDFSQIFDVQSPAFSGFRDQTGGQAQAQRALADAQRERAISAQQDVLAVTAQIAVKEQEIVDAGTAYSQQQGARETERKQELITLQKQQRTLADTAAAENKFAEERERAAQTILQITEDIIAAFVRRNILDAAALKAAEALEKVEKNGRGLKIRSLKLNADRSLLALQRKIEDQRTQAARAEIDTAEQVLRLRRAELEVARLRRGPAKDAEEAEERRGLVMAGQLRDLKDQQEILQRQVRLTSFTTTQSETRGFEDAQQILKQLDLQARQFSQRAATLTKKEQKSQQQAAKNAAASIRKTLREARTLVTEEFSFESAKKLVAVLGKLNAEASTKLEESLLQSLQIRKAFDETITKQVDAARLLEDAANSVSQALEGVKAATTGLAEAIVSGRNARQDRADASFGQRILGAVTGGPGPELAARRTLERLPAQRSDAAFRAETEREGVLTTQQQQIQQLTRARQDFVRTQADLNTKTAQARLKAFEDEVRFVDQKTTDELSTINIKEASAKAVLDEQKAAAEEVLTQIETSTLGLVNSLRGVLDTLTGGGFSAVASEISGIYNAFAVSTEAGWTRVASTFIKGFTSILDGFNDFAALMVDSVVGPMTEALVGPLTTFLGGFGDGIQALLGFNEADATGGGIPGVNLQGRFGDLSPSEKARVEGEIEAQNKAREAQADGQDEQGPQTAEEAALQALTSAMDQAIAQANALVNVLPELLQTFFDRLISELPALARTLATAISDGIRVITANFGDILAALVDAFDEILPAVLEALGEAIPVIIVEILKNLPAIVWAVVKGLFKGVGGLFSGIASIFHDGGTVKASGRNPGMAARMHAMGAPAMANGGFVGAPSLDALVGRKLAADDVPTVLQVGERVVSNREIADVGGPSELEQYIQSGGRGNNSGGGGGGPSGPLQIGSFGPAAISALSQIVSGLMRTQSVTIQSNPSLGARSGRGRSFG